ncbi:MAG: hypothetical protein PHS44_04520 [Candidatus Dojkabacteria bacterium]|jgi:hypothetical protein|nr:hypothetical protein [Candidatus Dojkabacteria bacterium]
MAEKDQNEPSERFRSRISRRAFMVVLAAAAGLATYEYLILPRLVEPLVEQYLRENLLYSKIRTVEHPHTIGIDPHLGYEALSMRPVGAEYSVEGYLFHPGAWKDNDTLVIFQGCSVDGYIWANKQSMIPIVNKVVAQGFNVIMLSYRGHPMTSTERDPNTGYLKQSLSYGPNEIQDGLLVVRYILEVLNIPPERLHLHGSSLGTAVSIAVAKEYSVSTLFLDSVIADMAEGLKSGYCRFTGAVNIDKKMAEMLLELGYDISSIVPIRWFPEIFTRQTKRVVLTHNSRDPILHHAQLAQYEQLIKDHPEWGNKANLFHRRVGVSLGAFGQHLAFRSIDPELYASALVNNMLGLTPVDLSHAPIYKYPEQVNSDSRTISRRDLLRGRLK